MVVKILEIKRLTHDVKSFKVEKPKNYSFVPGQAVDLAINKAGWRREKRPFTFTSLNSEPFLEFIIKEYPLDIYPNHKGLTQEIHKLEKGDSFIIGKPWGAISYQGPGVFIAGGTGITPFIAIIRQLEKDKRLLGNRLIFSNKTRKDIILKEEFKSIFPKRDLILTLTREKVKGYEYGRVNADFLKRHIDNFKQRFYLCGPRQMVLDLRETLSSLGASIESMVFEK